MIDTNVTIKVELTVLQLRSLLKLEELAEKIDQMYSEDVDNQNETIDMLWNKYAYATCSGLVSNIVKSVKKDLEDINNIL